MDGSGMDGSGAHAPRRRPPEGGYARGEETRERIIEAAFSVFADEGYVGASTRRIAAEAGVNPPALQYYFDSKEGLHRACGLEAVARVMRIIGPAVDRAGHALSNGSRIEAAEAMCVLLEGIAELAMTDRQVEHWTRFMSRCQTDTLGPGFAVLEADFSTPLRRLTTGLTGRALDLPPGDPTAPLHAMMIFGHASVLSLKRDTVLSIMGWTDFAGDHAALVKAILRDHVLRVCQAT
jgi:AcrR family transcriptional regulator